MSFSDAIKDSVLHGFSHSNLSTTEIIVTLALAFALSLYAHLVYRFLTRNAFYSKNFAMTLIVLSVITAGILLAMQSSLVISLGMVGALSIIRFRTAIKDPLDLLFLFWSISIGIICGAGLFELAILVSLAATFALLLFNMFPVKRGNYLLIIHAAGSAALENAINIIKNSAQYIRLKSKNTSSEAIEAIFEIHLKDSNTAFTETLSSSEGIHNVHLLENDVDTKF